MTTLAGTTHPLLLTLVRAMRDLQGRVDEGLAETEREDAAFLITTLYAQVIGEKGEVQKVRLAAHGLANIYGRQFKSIRLPWHGLHLAADSIVNALDPTVSPDVKTADRCLTQGLAHLDYVP